MNILIIRLSSMGDVILTTPVLTWLAQTYPSCRITMLTDSRYASLFCNDPRVAQVIGIDRTGSMMQQIGELKNTVWNRIVDLQHSRRSTAIRRWIGSSAPTGLFHKNHIRRLLLLFFRIDRYDTDEHVIRRYLRAAGAAAESEYPPASICCNTADAAVLMQRFYPGNGTTPVLALIPFSAWKNKEWLRSNFVAVGRAFATMGWNVAILGGPEDTQHADTVAREIGVSAVSVAGRMSLYDSACLLHGCTLALGNDTGLSHLARACGVKTGIIFGATTRHFGFFPTGKPLFRVFEAAVCCRPCHPHGGTLCWRGTRPCLTRILFRDVIAGLKALHEQGESK